MDVREVYYSGQMFSVYFSTEYLLNKYVRL